MTDLPEGIVRSLAAQFFIDRNKNLDALDDDAIKKKMALDLRWKDDAALWASLPEEDKKEFTEAARSYIMDWVSRYPRYSSTVLNKWLEVDYKDQ